MSEESRLIVETIPGLIVVVSPAGEIEDVNRLVLDYFGRTLEELRHRAITDAVHPADFPRVTALWQQAIESGLPYEFEHRIRRFDGQYRWFQIRGLPVRAADGRIVRWHLLLTDIDARKQSEERLRRSEAYLAEAQRLTHTGSWALKPGLEQFVHWSDELSRIHGLDPREGVPTLEGSNEACFARISFIGLPCSISR